MTSSSPAATAPTKQPPPIRAADLRNFDEQGWAAIHHASFRGYVKSIDRFIGADIETAALAVASGDSTVPADNERRLTELTTRDGLEFTPLHLAAMGGHVEAVHCLVEHGADLEAVNVRRHGVVELAAFGRHVAVLGYLLARQGAAGDRRSEPSAADVWSRLMAFMLSETEDEATAAAESVRDLVGDVRPSVTTAAAGSPSDEGQGRAVGLHVCRRQAVEAGIMQLAVKLIKATTTNAATKAAALSIVNSLMSADSGQEKEKDVEDAGDNGIGSKSRQLAFAAGIIPVAIRLLAKSTPDLVRQSSRTLSILSSSTTPAAPLPYTSTAGSDRPASSTIRNYAAEAVKHGAIPALVAVIQDDGNEPRTLIDVVEALGSVVGDSPTARTAVGSIHGVARSIVGLYSHVIGPMAEILQPSPAIVAHHWPSLLALAITRTVARLVRDHADNQNGFVDAGVTSRLIALLRHGDVTVQAATIDAMLCLADGNAHAQRSFVDDADDDVIGALLNIVTRPAIQSHQLRNLTRENHLQHQRLCVAVQRSAARAVWQVTGNDITLQRLVAERIGIKRLLEFVNLPPGVSGGGEGSTARGGTLELQYVGSEGIGALCRSANFRSRDEAADCGAVHSLVRLLRSDAESLVVSVVRTLRRLTVGVGYRTHSGNQLALVESRGVRLLAALAAHADDRRLRAEAYYTLASAALGCTDVMTELRHHANFNFRWLLSLLRSTSDDPRTQSTVGCALATFAFNSLSNQKEIIDAAGGGIQFATLLPLLHSNDDLIRCRAAFQVVVLARVMLDVEPAVSSAAGIKLLVDIIRRTGDEDRVTAAANSTSTRDAVEGLAADCIARLSHTRHGIREAFVSISAVEYLADLLQSPCELVRGGSVVALGYLSADHLARRQLMKRCRQKPQLMDVLMHYSDCTKISTNLLSDWQHYIQFIKLPPIKLSTGTSRRGQMIGGTNRRISTSRRSSCDDENSRPHNNNTVTQSVDTSSRRRVVIVDNNNRATPAAAAILVDGIHVDNDE
jgi:ankyrin repeat protein